VARVGNLLAPADSGGGSNGSVAQRVLLDLQTVHADVAREQEYFAAANNRERGKRLLFLFQRDLLPGVSGKILESKGQRDNIAVKYVSWQSKVVAWSILGALNVGMLFYILLFALSQTVHRQGAWALSFALWLVVEVLLVSSSTVLFTHVMIPSLIMQDVNKIKQKLAESIRAFNDGVKSGVKDRTTTTEEGNVFNAAAYLFASTKLAQEWSELREAQIIALFRTPWPKQSYQRENNVSQAYSKKYTALTRSASIIAIFFLTQLLQIPPNLQDMIVQVVTTTSVGYTVLLHIDLYRIFPLLAFLPVLLVLVVVHFLIQSGKANAKQELAHLFPVPVKPAEAIHKGLRSGSDGNFQASKVRSVASADESGFDRGSPLQPEAGSDTSDSSNEGGELHLPLRSAAAIILLGKRARARLSQAHISRRQSVQQAKQLLKALKTCDGEAEEAKLIATTEVDDNYAEPEEKMFPQSALYSGAVTPLGTLQDDEYDDAVEKALAEAYDDASHCTSSIDSVDLSDESASDTESSVEPVRTVPMRLTFGGRARPLALAGDAAAAAFAAGHKGQEVRAHDGDSVVSMDLSVSEAGAGVDNGPAEAQDKLVAAASYATQPAPCESPQRIAPAPHVLQERPLQVPGDYSSDSLGLSDLGSDDDDDGDGTGPSAGPSRVVSTAASPVPVATATDPHEERAPFRANHGVNSTATARSAAAIHVLAPSADADSDSSVVVSSETSDDEIGDFNSVSTMSD
jgi:hypothetical protein